MGVVRDLKYDVSAPSLYRAFVPLPQAWAIPPRALSAESCCRCCSAPRRSNPVVLGLTVLVLVAAAALASLFPVWRALRVNPAVALAAE
jgi:hypothetical protein